MKIGITGQNGFIGKHLYNYLSLKEEIELVPFNKDFFNKEIELENFVKECDTIIHLAAVNRNPDEQYIYKTNIELVNKIIIACEKTSSTPHVIFSSSTQEEKDNPYGASKKKGREALESWSLKSGSLTTGMIIPNVFGPYGKPYYNSVVATFCHQVAREEKPTVLNDGLLKLIYINELIEEIHKLVLSKKSGKVIIEHKHEIQVSGLLNALHSIKEKYYDNGEIPTLETPFNLALFNTFRCYLPASYFPRLYKKHTDNRGAFVEIIRTNTSGQFSFSTTKPGITRGNHYHTRKAERFSVIQGKASIKIRNINSQEIIEYIIDGQSPGYVDMPIWCTHNITNIGSEELITLFWINEPYNPDNSDTYFLNV